jgi:hypothetical protein
MTIKLNACYEDVAPREVRDLVEALGLKIPAPVWWVGHRRPT